MAAPTLSGLFQIGIDILNVKVVPSTKRILVQTGSVTGKTVDSDNVEMWQQTGFVSLPVKPVPGKQAAQGFVVRCGDYDVMIASQDDRGRALYGDMKPGETCVYGAGEDGNSQGRMLIKSDGSVTLYTTKGNTKSGTSVAVSLTAEGAISLASEHGVFQIAGSGITCISKTGAGFKLDATGVSIIGKQLALNAGNVALGGSPATGVATLATMAPLIASVQALCTAITNLVSAEGAGVTALVPTTGIADPSGTIQPAWIAAVAAVGAANAALQATLALPTNFSTSVSAAR